MILAQNYQTVYLLFVLLLTVLSFIRYYSSSVPLVFREYNNDSELAFVLTLGMILFIGLRPVSPVFADMSGYYHAMVDHRYEYVSLSISGNFLYVLLMRLMSSIGSPPQMAIIVLAFINFFFSFLAAKKMFPGNVFVTMLVFFASFSTFAYATNGLKAGCASALFLCALAYRDDWRVFIPFLIASFGFHHSMELPVVAFVCCYLYKNTNFYLVLWFACLLLALSHVTFFQNLFANFTDDYGAKYLLGGNYGGRGGFRLDFIIYSVVPIIIRQYLVNNKNYIPSEEYTFIFNVYVLTNAIWLLCMYANFSNRIAYLSWCIYPIVLIHPFLKSEKFDVKFGTFPLVLLGNLFFTLFMVFVYA